MNLWCDPPDRPRRALWTSRRVGDPAGSSAAGPIDLRSTFTMLRLPRPSRRALAVLAPVAVAAVAIPSVAMAAGSSSGHLFHACVDETGYVWETVMDADPGCAALQAYLA